MFDAKLRLDFGTENELMARLGLEDHGRVQQAIDKMVIDYMLPYWAWDTGTLARSAYTASDIGSGEIVYPGPYAHYQYMGIVYGPNIPIFEDDSGVPTRWTSPSGQPKRSMNRPLEYKTDVNPLAGSHPFERMIADHLNDILEGARNVVLNQ